MELEAYGDQFPEEIMSEYDDDGTMPNNVAELRSEVIGHRIVSARYEDVDHDSHYFAYNKGLVLTLDNGKRVSLHNSSDCCAYTELESFLLNPELVDHVITGVGTEDGYTKWHIYADMGDVLSLSVGWSSGNPFYYGYGFYINVENAPAEIEQS